jgi:hypothetical protein
MQPIKHPIPKTIIYGLICGLTFVPLSLILNTLISWPSAICLVLWFFISGYAVILNLWSDKSQISTVFPLLLLVPTIFLTDSITLFFILALMTISWIRSGICFLKPVATGLPVELLLCLSGAVLVIMFTPGSVFAWAVGVWMFFLIQTLYFVFFAPAGNQQEESSRLDAFERASRQAERILTDVYLL